MPKFMSSHTVPPGMMKREQVDQMAAAAQSDATVKPYRSFCNLSEGKIFCVMEAPNKQALAAWFEKTSNNRKSSIVKLCLTVLCNPTG